jgi:hypothetical protein
MATYFDHQSYVESKWCSILDGIILATAKGQGSIDLENDNLAVVNSIIHGRRPSKYYDYYWSILESIKDFDYVGLRWIPRELNRADELFRF